MPDEQQATLREREEHAPEQLQFTRRLEVDQNVAQKMFSKRPRGGSCSRLCR
jgi:hypothetical protein